ncbi:hypothetical protein EVG20_g7616 [Dentipellis fragilis]|uniref:Uncharacterized protein n=1 Tax=Dentipellis fragilis TaxID=205917 RepID=A0A4Y9YDW3_9AGAM|nr:hypothetical protein EVG20_g7616 [Dentipellis fragilis]
MSHQRRKISDLGPAEAAELLTSLQSFEDKFSDVDMSDSEDVGPGLAESLHGNIGRLRDKLMAVAHSPSSRPAPATGKISLVSMYLKEDKIPGLVRVSSTPDSGEASAMSAGHLRQMVDLARKQVFNDDAGGDSVFINLFLLRLAVLLKSSNIRIFSERSADALGLVWGSMTECRLVELPTNPKLHHGAHGIVRASVFVAKRDQESDLLPRAALALASHCRTIGVKHMRGAVSSGLKWVFFVWRESEDGTDTQIRYSLPFDVDSGENGMELVVGLLKLWRMKRATRELQRTSAPTMRLKEDIESGGFEQDTSGVFGHGPVASALKLGWCRNGINDALRHRFSTQTYQHPLDHLVKRRLSLLATYQQ